MKALLSFFVVISAFVSAANSENRTHHIEKRRVTEFHWLTDIQKKLIVDKHNELRKIVNPPASDMLKMSWDTGLEELATVYTRKCLFVHNKERKLAGFSYIGENLYVGAGKKITDNYGPGAVVSWDDEKAFYNYYTMKCQPNKVCGHYTQTAWASSYKVGCGMSTCNEVNVFGKIWKGATIFACNYAPGGNNANQKIYQQGARCSKCPTGYRCDDGLCTNSGKDSGFLSKSVMAVTCVFHSVVLVYAL